MNNNERLILRRELEKLAKLYRRPMDHVIMNMYIESLEDLPIGVVLRALKNVIKSKTFLPSIAEIRELCPKYKPIEITKQERRDFEIPKAYAGQILEFLRKKS